jgi:Methyltransferase FkbM domain
VIGGCHETFEARVTTLDEYARLNNIAAFDLVKIDVEGHEPQVFKGCERLFADRAVRRIMFEVNNTCLGRAGTGSGELVKVLRESGFSLRILNADGGFHACPDEPEGDWTTVVACLTGKG